MGFAATVLGFLAFYAVIIGAIAWRSHTLDEPPYTRGNDDDEA